MTGPVDHLKRIAQDTLEVFEAVEDAAIGKLQATVRARQGDVFVTGADNRMGQAVDLSSQGRHSLSGIQQQLTADLGQLAREPALVRIVAREESGEPTVYYISRVTPVPPSGSPYKFTSYRTPMGRMAARQVGDEVEIEIRGVRRRFEILERACVTPQKATQWDGTDNVFQLEDGSHRAAPSLQGLLDWQTEEVDDGDILAELLGDHVVPRVVLDVARRRVVDRMELRDRPALDRFQDEIFRKPLDEQLMISGPPGSGKTTTLIKRLGQKLDLQALEEEEAKLVERFQQDTARPFRESWIMFTPTELLKQYLKEAFNKEGIAAPESRIRTWSQHRRELARDVVPILRSFDRGVFSLDDTCNFLTVRAMQDTPVWFEDFQQYHAEWVASTLVSAARHLAASANERAKAVGERALRILLSSVGQTSSPTASASSVLALHSQREEAEELIRVEKSRIDETVKAWVSALVRKNRAALDELAAAVSGDPATAAPEDDDEDEEDEEDKAPETGQDIPESPEERRQRAFRVATTGLRSIARARRSGKQIRPTSQAGKVLVWMGGSLPSDPDLRALGDRLALARELRVISRPIRLFLDRIPSVYGSFRRRRLADETWYQSDATEAIRRQALNGLEVDLLLLLFLTRSRELEELLTGSRMTEIESGNYFELVRSLRGMRRAQVLVDEATDFSPLQLRCMVALTHPATRSFYASGDLLQRVTAWGIRDLKQMRWVAERIEFHDVSIGYRQTQQLTAFADRLAKLAGAPRAQVKLPESVDSSGVQPVLGERLNEAALVEWIACRVLEIQRRVGRFPSIAVLVHDEAAVEPLAMALADRLRDSNAAVVACPHGRVVGSDGDVRVFDVKHIKGLEFEAALFAGIDSLQAASPDLFDKLLYVGATRAATFLGIACTGELPEALAPLRDMLVDRWR